ncbi:MAG: glycosyltransferase family 39 protein [Planctomycetota bacterium]
MTAALPLAFQPVRADWRYADGDPHLRVERWTAQRFLQLNGKACFWWVTLGRWACIPFVILGAYVCSLWACDLYGEAAGFAAAALWSLSPYVLGHGALITTDAHAASMGVVAAYCYWRWLHRPSMQRAIVAGIALGLAALTKYTLLVLYPCFFIVFLMFRTKDAFQDCRVFTRDGIKLATVFVVSVVIIQAGHGFDDCRPKLGNLTFRSTLFRNAQSLARDEQTVSPIKWLARNTPVPLPRAYLLGLDTQLADFQRGYPSYLRGEWRNKGWWYYYLYGLCVKTPIGSIVLVFMALAITFIRPFYNRNWKDEWSVLLPFASIFILVSAQTGFSLHLRYVLPALPFLGIWISKLFQSSRFGDWTVLLVSSTALVHSSASSLAVYPHSLSYFNELVGGPEQGYKHLSGSNVSWGQDLIYLAEWLKEHPEVQDLRLASYGPIDPRLTGIEFTVPPVAPDHAVGSIQDDHGSRSEESLRSDDTAGPLPGWYAIDVNFLAGDLTAVHNGSGERQDVCTRYFNLKYFENFTPVARIGYSFHVYHLPMEDANQLRSRMRLPLLTTEK